MNSKPARFDHEKFNVYHRSLRFITWTTIKSKIMSKIKNSAATRLLIFIFLLILISPAQSADWPRWGGNDLGRNMYSAAKGLPDRFDPGKPKPGTEDIDLSTTKNVKWVARLGSQAYGNVVVSGGRVFIGTNNENPRDPAHHAGSPQKLGPTGALKSPWETSSPDGSIRSGNCGNARAAGPDTGVAPARASKVD